MPSEPEKNKTYQISELAPGGPGNIDDGQDFDPRSDTADEVGASDPDPSRNHGNGSGGDTAKKV